MSNQYPEPERRRRLSRKGCVILLGIAPFIVLAISKAWPV